MSGNVELYAKILARCARHCSMCRKFKPTQLHIHHIVPKEDGGDDSEENLAPLCTECHSNIHTRMSMTKNFSATEIRMARDQMYNSVQTGKLHGAASLSELEIDGLADALSIKLNKHSEKKSPFRVVLRRY